MFYYMYQAMSRAIGGAWEGLAGALKGPVGVLSSIKASEDPGLIDPKGSSWSLLSDLLDEGRLVRASWPLRTSRPRPLTEVIFLQTDWLTCWVGRF